MPSRREKIIRARPHSAPGTLSQTNNQSSQKARINIFDYTAAAVEEKEIESIENCLQYKDSSSVTWINVEGINTDVLTQLGTLFGIHPLVCEDILNTGQRPKFESYDDYAFIVIKMISYNKEADRIESEQISLILGKKYVFSFQEHKGDVFEPVRDRIRTAKGRIRKMGADYLSYCLLDAVVDNYFFILEDKGLKLEELEDRILGGNGSNPAHVLHRHKYDISFLRKQIWPLREVLSNLHRDECRLITKDTRIYLRDAYDNTIQVMDTIESFRDMLSGLHDIHLSNISNRMNEIMKVLTMISTIFIPITFMAGVYGMNFEYIPELKWRFGYFGLLGIMTLTTVLMLAFFKKKKWL